MLYLTSTGMGWEEILEEFAAHQRSKNLSEKTIQNRSECLLRLGKLTSKGPLDITERDLERMLGRTHYRTGKRLAQGTMQSERSYLQAFFRWLKRSKYRKSNPAKHLEKIKMMRRHPRPLRIEQIDGMLDTGAYSRTRDLIMIGALTGLRIGEIVKIRGEDLDGNILTTIRKGGLHHRVVLADALDELRNRYPKTGWWFPSPYKNKQFPNGDGHILMKSASASVGAAIRRAGITDRNLTGHSLRHYIATTMLHEGVPIRVVQETLGHASLATTQIYTEVTEDELRDGINVVPAIEFREHAVRRARIAA